MKVYIDWDESYPDYFFSPDARGVEVEADGRWVRKALRVIREYADIQEDFAELRRKRQKK